MDKTQKTIANPIPQSLPEKPSGLKLVPKKRMGKYRLQKRIGKGGYCEIWKARDTVEGIWVALKIPNPDVAGKRDNETIFREVRLVAGLRHPHIMPVKNADIIEGHALLATELSSGTLGDCSYPMSVKRILLIIRQVLDGLAYAHQKRLVHCDVSPENIFLFPDGRAALGDFGIGVPFKARMKTIDDFGTPGYVAPEQAYGKPTYRSDCFSVGLILYQYLTGFLPSWPFHWPPKGVERLRERTGNEFVQFIKKSLSMAPEKRFANARQMLAALDQSLPNGLRKKIFTTPHQRMENWRQLRKKSFLQRYTKAFPVLHTCIDCGEPIAESMQCCPWCGSTRNKYDYRTPFTHICVRCHKGISPEWPYCPWCYGPGYKTQQTEKNHHQIQYKTHCGHCGGKMMNFMRYCPWCHRKQSKKYQVNPFPEICMKCGWSVDTDYWIYCPWCEQKLFE